MRNMYSDEMRHSGRKIVRELGKRDALIAAGLAYYKSSGSNANISITKFEDKPKRVETFNSHVAAYRVAMALNAGKVTKLDAGKPVVAMKYWDKDYRTGKGGW